MLFSKTCSYNEDYVSIAFGIRHIFDQLCRSDPFAIFRSREAVEKRLLEHQNLASSRLPRMPPSGIQRL